MLVLSRKVGQSIVIDGRISVTIVEMSGGRVRLGVAAPLEVPVHRAEVQQRIVREGDKLTLPPLTSRFVGAELSLTH